MIDQFLLQTMQNDVNSALKNLDDEQNYRSICDFFEKVCKQMDSDPYFFDKNKLTADFLFNEVYPQLFRYLISAGIFQPLLFWTSLFVKMCNYLSFCRNFLFIPYLSKLFDLLKNIKSDNKYYLTFLYQTQTLINFVETKSNLNIYTKYLIDQLVQVQIIQAQVIHILINDILSHQTFSEIHDIFHILNNIFPYINKEVLKQYEDEFSRYSYSIDDPRFDDPESINLTKAMATCSVKFAQLHFDNLIKFIKLNNKQAKEEFVNLITHSESLNAISKEIVDNFDIILPKLRDEKSLLSEISSILISNEIVSKSFFIEKAGFDLFYNLAFFDLVKDQFTLEKVNKIIESETFSEETANFGFKLIDYKIDLLPDISSFLKTTFSSFWHKERIETIIAIAKQPSNRQILLDSINNYEINNQQEYRIILQILMLLKPTTNEFNYNNFVNEILNYTDSIFILPFLLNNSFIPVNSIDIELLVSYSIFNKELSDFLFKNFSDSLFNYVDFFLTFQIEDDIECPSFIQKPSNKIFGRFLFELYKLNNCGDSRLIWESVIRVKDEDEEIHQIAQKIINENPEKSQKEIIEKVEDGYSKYFVNFDFSNFSEISAEENGNYLIFNKPQLVSTDSLFYFASKVRHALNYSEPIEKDDVIELFEFRIGDIGIDAIILNTAFEASKKINIDFPLIEESVNISIELKYRTFLDKLVDHITNSQEEIISINEELINSLVEIDDEYAIKLIQNKKVSFEILFKFFSNYKNPKSLLFLTKLNFIIPINLMNQIIFTKGNFVDFCKFNRIEPKEILPFIFSKDFPQFYRTKFVMKNVLNNFITKPEILLNYLKTKTWKYVNKDIKRYFRKNNFIPIAKSTKYYNIYLAFARIIPYLTYFKKQKYSLFLSSIIYSREGEEDSFLYAPINELKNSILSLKSEKNESPEYQIDQFIERIIRKLPNQVIKYFELFYIENDSRFLSDYNISHDFQMKIQEKSISEELNHYRFINHPLLLMFLIQQKKDFQIEKSLIINFRKYELSSIITKSNLFTPDKNKFTKWSNGKKEKVELINEEPLLIFYHLAELKEDEDVNSNQFYIMKNKIEKFRASNYKFNERAVICDSFNKAEIEWNKWEQNETLFEIATILLSEVGYSGLFRALNNNVNFSKFFFNSNWQEKFSVQNCKEELINLANIYPQKEELLEILFKSIKDQKRQHFLSIIFTSFDLNEYYIEKLIDTISPSFDNFEEILLNYFLKKTTTNKLLLSNEKLAEFVLSRIEKQFIQNDKETVKDEQNLLLERKKSHPTLDTLPFSHLLDPLTDKLFIACLKCLSQSSIHALLSSFSQSNSYILKALTILPHTDELATIYCRVMPTSQEDCCTFKENLRWIEFGLSSKNQSIRRHTYILFKMIFNKDDSEILTPIFEGVILKSLFQPYFKEVKEFIEIASEVPFNKTSDFTASIYNKIFTADYIHENQPEIAQYINTLPAPPQVMIPRWKEIIDHTEGHFFKTMGLELIIASIRCCYKPRPTYFVNIIQCAATEHDYPSIEVIMQFLSLSLTDENIHDYLRLIIEFEKWVPYYIHLINNIMINIKEFRETQLIILAIILPTQVISQRKCLDLAFDGFNNDGDIFISSLKIAIHALELILDKKAFIRHTTKGETDTLTGRLFNLLIVKYFSDALLFLFDIYLGQNRAKIECLEKWRIEVVKYFIKYLTLCSIAFPRVLRIIYSFLQFNSGIGIFGPAFSGLENEWSELCCEISLSILADISFDNIDHRLTAVSIIVREFVLQLDNYNSADKNYLRFLIGVMKNDQLREESNLKEIVKIFNVFRNNLVLYIDDIALFIETSLDKYDDFFNDNEIKNFILKLRMDDHQIHKKLLIINSLLEKRPENMKNIITEVFSKFEELTNTDVELSDELSDLLNNVFEQALMIYSSVE